MARRSEPTTRKHLVKPCGLCRRALFFAILRKNALERGENVAYVYAGSPGSSAPAARRVFAGLTRARAACGKKREGTAETHAGG
jgi:hypothetical protein